MWVLMQPFFYALRPIFIYPKNPTALEIISVSIQLVFDYWVYTFFGKLTVINTNFITLNPITKY